MKKISIVLPDLRGGGAERLAIYLANDWLQRGYTVEFVLMQKRGELLSLLSPGIHVVDLGVDRIRKVIAPLSKHLKRTGPDVVWAGMWPLTSAAVLAWLLAGRSGKVFLTDHNQLSISCMRELGMSPLWLKTVMNATYPFATGVTAVSKGVAEDVRRLGGFAAGRVKVIYNPAATGLAHDRATEVEREKLWGRGYRYHILSVGTLKKQKNHALLIEAFARLPKTLKAKLTILGEGELRSQLEALVASLGLQNSVALPGFDRETAQWYRSADLFVLSSDWEGFGNVIVEALECGVPVVSTDCPSGPAEILENGRYGILVQVGDVAALAQAIAAHLQKGRDRAALIERAKDFSVASISAQYLDYFGLPSHA